jgi:GDP-D-mannose dehydratase
MFASASLRVTLITSVTGRDGSYFAGLLLDQGYIARGIKPRTSLINTDRIDQLHPINASEVYGLLQHVSQTETTTLSTRSRTRWQKSYACNEIPLNNKSQVRDETVARRKIARTAAEDSPDDLNEAAQEALPRQRPIAKWLEMVESSTV